MLVSKLRIKSQFHKSKWKQYGWLNQKYVLAFFPVVAISQILPQIMGQSYDNKNKNEKDTGKSYKTKRGRLTTKVRQPRLSEIRRNYANGSAFFTFDQPIIIKIKAIRFRIGAKSANRIVSTKA